MMSRKTKSKHKFAHELLAETAKEFAGTWYEEAAHDNEFYSFYPSQEMFINREWSRFVEAARLQLSKMLGMSSVPEYQKEQIFEALVKHASLPGNVDTRIAQKVITGELTPDSLMVVH